MALYDDVVKSLNNVVDNYCIIIDISTLRQESLTTFFMKAAPLLLEHHAKIILEQENYQALKADTKATHSLKTIDFMLDKDLVALKTATEHKSKHSALDLACEQAKQRDVLLITQDQEIYEHSLSLKDIKLVIKKLNDLGAICSFDGSDEEEQAKIIEEPLKPKISLADSQGAISVTIR